MTALNADFNRSFRDGEIVQVPLEANARLYAGSIVEINAAGRGIAATKGANKTYLGVSLENKAGGSVAGAVKAQVRIRGAYKFATTGTAVLGKKAHVADDNTVTDAPAGASVMGVIIQTESDGVWVTIDRR